MNGDHAGVWACWQTDDGGGRDKCVYPSAEGPGRVGKSPSLEGRRTSRFHHGCGDLSPWLNDLALEAVLLTISVRHGEPWNLSSNLTHMQLKWVMRHPAFFCLRTAWAPGEPNCSWGRVPQLMVEMEGVEEIPRLRGEGD